MATYDGACETSTTDLTKTCDTSKGLICKSQKCACAADTKVWKTDKCQSRQYGDSCSNTTQCDTGIYTAKGDGGAVCTSSSCACGSGYDNVKRLVVNPDGNDETITVCLKSYTKDLGKNETCTIVPELISSSGAKVCSTSFHCVPCTGDAAGEGVCRSVTTSSSSSSSSNSDSGTSITRNQYFHEYIFLFLFLIFFAWAIFRSGCQRHFGLCLHLGNVVKMIKDSLKTLLFVFQRFIPSIKTNS